MSHTRSVTESFYINDVIFCFYSLPVFNGHISYSICFYSFLKTRFFSFILRLGKFAYSVVVS